MNSIYPSTLELIDETSDLSPIEHSYNAPSDVICVGELYIKLNTTYTECIHELQSSEPDVVPYECCRASGVLSFWDDPKEDIYTFEDGQPI